MELDVREWLVIVGILLIIAVLLDGFRRMRNDRKGKIKMALKKHSFDDDKECPNTELPNGGARLKNERIEPTLDSGDELQGSLQLSHPPGGERQPEVNKQSLSQVADEAVAQEELAAVEVNVPATAGPEPQTLVLMAVAGEQKQYAGADILQILLACGVRLGERDIFHRYDDVDGKSCLQFSVANMTEAGTFSLDNIEQQKYQGIVFFMEIPGPEDPMMAFDYMYETAQCVVKNLGGMLINQARQQVDPEFVESLRMDIMESERKRLTCSA